MNDNRRIPVAGIGRPTPPGMGPQGIVDQMLQSIQMEGDHGPTLNPDVFQHAPPWVSYLANMCQNMRVEVASFKLALVRRGLITEAEFAEALLTISRAYQEQVVSSIQNLERQMNQKPAAPTNPRQSPT